MNGISELDDGEVLRYDAAVSSVTTTLIRNARLWPHAGAAVQEDASLLIENGRILKTGRFHARADLTIDAGGALAMPGFVQGHVHLCQTLFRGAAEDLPLLPWLSRRIWPLEAAHDEASLRVSARLACAELVRGGTTAFLSMETVRGSGFVLEEVARAGLMGMVCPCLMDKSGGYMPLAVDLDDALAECDVLLRRLEGLDTLRLGLAPRFALSCDEATLREAARFARERGLRLHTHASEQQPEVEMIRKRTGRYNVEYLHDLGLCGPDVALAHCVHLTRAECGLLARTGTHVLHCPSANFKLGSGIAPVPAYLEAGINIALGADGAACNNRLNMFAEMRLAGLAQAMRKGPGALPAQAIVRMATEGGARALGWEKEMGRLEPGLRANLILLDLDQAHTLPSEEPAATVVYACDARSVSLTMVNGHVLYENGQLTTLDETALRAESRRERARLFRRAGIAG